MIKVISAWLHRAVLTSPSSRLVEACASDLKPILEDNGYLYPSKVWKEVIAAATYLDEYVLVSGNTILLPHMLAEAWRDNPQPLVNLMDFDDGITILHIKRDGCETELAVTGKPAQLKKLKELLPRARRKTILFGMTLEQLTKALSEL